ncbi:MAG: hypothetical protein LBJ75_04350 [Puniceicoccales bacterium]|jgi:hypothetical protein|nr:hypothetical protein [Puniceicoccales bacterium]
MTKTLGIIPIFAKTSGRESIPEPMAVPDSKKIAFKVFFMDIEIVKFLRETIQTTRFPRGRDCKSEKSN